MDRNMIMIVALIAVIAAILVGILATMPQMEKQDTNITFKSNATLTEGDSIKIKLTDANGTAIANQTVNVTVTDKNNASDYHSVIVNEKGIATLKLNKSSGEYDVTVIYGGNDNYTGCNATQKLTIKEKEKAVEAEPASTSESSNSGGWTTVSPGGDAGSSIVVYHDGNGHKYVTRYSSDGQAYEDGVAYDEGAMITS